MRCIQDVYKNKIDNGSDMLMKKRFVLRWNVSNEEGSFACYNATLKFRYYFVRVLRYLLCITKVWSFHTPGKNDFN